MIFHEEARHNNGSRSDGHVKPASMQTGWQDLRSAVDDTEVRAWRRLSSLAGARGCGGVFRAWATGAFGLDGNRSELDGLDMNNDGRRDAG